MYPLLVTAAQYVYKLLKKTKETIYFDSTTIKSMSKYIFEISIGLPFE